NDSGKSSLLEVVQSLGKLATGPLPNAFSGGLSSLIWRKDPRLEFHVTVRWDTNEGEYSWRITFSPQYSLVDEQLQRAGQDLITLVRRQNQTFARFSASQRDEIGIGPQSSALSAAIQHPKLQSLLKMWAVPHILNSTCKYSLDPKVLGRPC